MILFLVRRLLAAIPLLLVVSVAVFFLVAVMPGDAASQVAGDSTTPGTLAQIRQNLGLDRPAHVRYLDWLGDALRGDFGRSYIRDTPVSAEIGKRIAVSVEVGAAAMAVAVAIGIPLGTLAALRRGSFLDLLLTITGVLGYSVPSFLVGIGLLYIFAFRLDMGFPIAGWTSPQESLTANLRTLVLPATTVGIVLAAAIMRLTRSAVLEVLTEDYVRTARAKGLREMTVIWGHVLKNALTPVVTIVGLQAGILVGGLVVTEQVFSIPGVGRFLVDATRGRDVPQIMAATMLIATGVALINILVDVLYTWLDPRVRVT
jgi:peptide/nickel transport system permease protein